MLVVALLSFGYQNLIKPNVRLLLNVMDEPVKTCYLNSLIV